MQRVVQLRSQASMDLVQIAQSIKDKVSPLAAKRWRDRVTTVLQSLANDAEQWPEADEAALLGVNLRCRIFGRRRHYYRVLYLFDDQFVQVISIRHAGRDYLSDDNL